MAGLTTTPSIQKCETIHFYISNQLNQIKKRYEVDVDDIRHMMTCLGELSGVDPHFVLNFDETGVSIKADGFENGFVVVPKGWEDVTEGEEVSEEEVQQNLTEEAEKTFHRFKNVGIERNKSRKIIIPQHQTEKRFSMMGCIL